MRLAVAALDEGDHLVVLRADAGIAEGHELEMAALGHFSHLLALRVEHKDIVRLVTHEATHHEYLGLVERTDNGGRSFREL